MEILLHRLFKYFNDNINTKVSLILCNIGLILNTRVCFCHCRAQWCQPTRRRVRQRTSAAGFDPAADCRARSQWCTTLWHIPDPSGVQRLCIQNTGPLLWDRVYSTQGHWWQQTQSGHPRGGQQNCRLQTRMPLNFCLGNQRQAFVWGSLQPG